MMLAVMLVQMLLVMLVQMLALMQSDDDSAIDH